MREMIMELKAKFEQQDEYGAVIVPLAMTLHKDETLALGLIMFFVGIFLFFLASEVGCKAGLWRACLNLCWCLFLQAP